MARLGSVLGAILADLTRARLIADELTRELIGEYRGDPMLASMSVPRLVVDEAALTLRFSVSELEEVREPGPDAPSVRGAWVHHASSTVVPRVLSGLGIPEEEHSTVIDAITEAAGKPVGVPPISEVRRAIAGEGHGMAAATAKPVLDAWSALPARVRSSLGTKTAFRGELEQDLREEVGPFIERQQEAALVKAALTSRIDVAVRDQDLPQDPARIQEFRITVRGQDLELLLEAQESPSP